MVTLKEKYNKTIIKQMMEKFGYANAMQVPKLVKVVVNRGVGEVVVNPKAFDTVLEELRMISGQQPLVIKAKKSIAAFKVRQGLSIGLKVTLRGNRMYEFMDKLTNLCLPRIRDFQGVNPRAFDGSGNYTLGVKEQLIFPEIDYDKIDKVRGMDITIVTSAKKDDEARELLKSIGFPFAK